MVHPVTLVRPRRMYLRSARDSLMQDATTPQGLIRTTFALQQTLSTQCHSKASCVLHTSVWRVGKGLVQPHEWDAITINTGPAFPQRPALCTKALIPDPRSCLTPSCHGKRVIVLVSRSISVTTQRHLSVHKSRPYASVPRFRLLDGLIRTGAEVYFTATLP